MSLFRSNIITRTRVLRTEGVTEQVSVLRVLIQNTCFARTEGVVCFTRTRGVWPITYLLHGVLSINSREGHTSLKLRSKVTSAGRARREVLQRVSARRPRCDTDGCYGTQRCTLFSCRLRVFA